VGEKAVVLTIITTWSARFLICNSLRKAAGTPRAKAEVHHVAAFEQRLSLDWRNTDPWQWRPPWYWWYQRFLSVRTFNKILPLYITIDCKYWEAYRGESWNRW
jgi:hypothetical protein